MWMLFPDFLITKVQHFGVDIHTLNFSMSQILGLPNCSSCGTCGSHDASEPSYKLLLHIYIYWPKYIYTGLFQCLKTSGHIYAGIDNMSFWYKLSSDPTKALESSD